ncbi:hypothetical protein ACFL2Q_11030 [Thermodesulfobacteriota bacterium]
MIKYTLAFLAALALIVAPIALLEVSAAQSDADFQEFDDSARGPAKITANKPIVNGGAKNISTKPASDTKTRNEKALGNPFRTRTPERKIKTVKTPGFFGGIASFFKPSKEDLNKAFEEHSETRSPGRPFPKDNDKKP